MTNNKIAGGKKMENNNYMHKEAVEQMFKRIEEKTDMNNHSVAKSLDEINKKIDSMQGDINQLKLESEKRKAFKSFFYSKEFIIVALLIIGTITGTNDIIKPLFGLLFG
jgi:TolA-binding protein